jgi:hypothetical protein
VEVVGVVLADRALSLTRRGVVAAVAVAACSRSAFLFLEGHYLSPSVRRAQGALFRVAL